MPGFFNTVRNGYDPEEVDKYIFNLEATLKSYKEKDEAIVNAIVNAQIAADNIIKNSEMASSQMRRSTLYQLDKVVDSIERQRQIIEGFQHEYNYFMEKYIKKVNEEEFNNMLGQVDALEKYFEKLKQENFESEQNSK